MIKSYFNPLLVFVLLFPFLMEAQENAYWSAAPQVQVDQNMLQEPARAAVAKRFRLEERRLEFLRSSSADPGRLSDRTLNIELPAMDGRMKAYQLKETRVLSPQLARKYPNIRTFKGKSKGEGQDQIHLTFGPNGLHAVVLHPNRKAEYIEPLTKDRSVYGLYASDSQLDRPSLECHLEETGKAEQTRNKAALANDLKLRTYRTAIAATGEYSQFHIALNDAEGLDEDVQRGIVLSAIATAVNSLNIVYENDLAIRLELIDNNDEIIYLDPDTDPYSEYDGDNTSTLLAENQSNVTSVIGSDNYDVGHLFSNAGFGVASLGSACVNSIKARGFTGIPNPVGATFYFDFVAHEFGHQFGANHTFNGTTGSCGANGQRNDETAMEPGSGSTLMAYAGLCSPQNVAGNSDLYFHAISIEEILSKAASDPVSCATETDLTQNLNVPVANAGPNFVIPAGTAYRLTGSGSDVDGDVITYCWEQMDNGVTIVPPSSTATTGALYRSLPPTEEATRYFPDLRTVVNGSVSSTWEVTPSVSRDINFRLTVRDNNPEAGQMDTDDLLISVTSAAGPFRVTSQDNADLVWIPGSNETVSWDPAGTTDFGINVSQVDVLLSIDGGLTFPIVLAANVPNDGSQSVVVPDQRGARCKVMVAARDHIFYAVNDGFFSIGEFNQVCSNVSSTDVPKSIPDNDPNGVVSIIDFDEDVTVEEVKVYLDDIEHTFIGDLFISLISPSGTELNLITGECGGILFEDISGAVLMDGGGEIDCSTTPPAISGTFDPAQPLSAFQGEDAQGQWQLKIVDTFVQDLGQLVNWRLEICYSEPVLSSNSFVFEGFKVYPNPTDGRLQVEFQTLSQERVDIYVYDLLGRTVKRAEFRNLNTRFEEALNLSDLAGGLYVMQVRNGNKMSSLKIQVK